MTITTWTRRLAVALLATASLHAGAADAWPTKPLRIIVYVGPGTLVDVSARFVAERLAEVLKQPVVVENMAGAGGVLGIRHVKNAPADGYTLLAATNTVAVAPVLSQSPGFEIKDFASVGGMNQAPLILVGPGSQPDKTFAELMARARAQPDTLSFASGGVGTSTFLSASMVLHQAGVKMLHVPYKGTGAAMPDVIGGRVNMMFDALNSTEAHIKEGRLRAFGVSSARRIAALPGVPTLAEQGLPGFAFTLYQGLMVRADTPREIVQTLSDALATVLRSEATRERFRRDGSEPFVTTPAEFDEFVRQDSARIAKMAADMGMQKQ